MKKLSTTLLLTLSTTNIIFPREHTKPQKLSKNPSNSNYKATIFLLHVSTQNLAPPSTPTIQGHQIHSRKPNGKAQTIDLIAFINLFG